MIQRHRQARWWWMGTALALLLTSSFAGASNLVLCLGADGHRVLELAHPGIECTHAATAGEADAISHSIIGTSIRPGSARSECLDLPAAGTGPIIMLSEIDPEKVPAPPTALLPVSPKPPAQDETRLPAPIAAGAGLSQRTRQLRSTVLLV